MRIDPDNRLSESMGARIFKEGEHLTLIGDDVGGCAHGALPWMRPSWQPSSMNAVTRG